MRNLIFDSHAHYDDRAFQADRDSLLSSLQAEGVGCVVNVGASIKTTEQTLELVRKYSFVYGAAGVHPDETRELDETSFQWLARAATEEKMVAVGEIGLDYYWDNTPRDVQQHWFRRQLALAATLQKPVIIHSREAAKDTLDIIRQEGGADLDMVIHCFSYGVEMARAYLDMGHYLGIGGVLTFKNAKKLKEVAAYVPADRILLETDCPYLAPEPFRGKRNDSAKLKFVVQELARIKEVELERIVEITWNNAKKFYRIPRMAGG